MSIDYEIKITDARVTTQGELSDVVKELAWVITGTEQGQSFSLPNVTRLGDADPENFTAYASATEADMVQWLEASETNMEAIKAHVAFVVERMVQQAALVQKPLPWAVEDAGA